MSDKVVVMNDGEIEQIGTPTEIYEKPASRFVADFIGDTNLLKGRYSVKDGGSVVEMDGVTLNTGNIDLKNGQGVTISIRPEKININSNSSNNVISLEGEVRETIYEGNIVKIYVSIGSHIIVVEKQTSGANHIPREGEMCTLSWNSSSMNVFGMASGR
jgi:ABC-type Fe3+/spermidine/putrescine transport system ATPase subunit